MSKSQFDAFNPARGPLAANMGTEKAWFTDDVLIAVKEWTDFAA